MITSNVLARTFNVSFGTSSGTAFTIDVDERQYLVSALHVFEGISVKAQIHLFRAGQWEPLDVEVVGRGKAGDVSEDVIVLSPAKQISPSFPMPATIEGLAFGQTTFFLGFPYGLQATGSSHNEYPLPLIKRAHFSGGFGPVGKPARTILLDGNNNPGFSGAPVVFRPFEDPSQDFRVAGVVSAFRTEDSEILFQGKPTQLVTRSNTGIIVVPSIILAAEMIAANPSGALIDKSFTC